MFTSGVQIKHQDILEKGIAQIGALQRKTSVRLLGSSALDLANVVAEYEIILQDDGNHKLSDSY